MLIGEFKHTLDNKNRVALPAKFRKEIGKEAVITESQDKCLSLYPLKEWEKVAENLSKLPVGQAVNRSFTRSFLAGARNVEIDNLGRILIPDKLKQYAGLSQDVIIIGIYKRIEIWNEKNWEEYKKKTEGESEILAEKLGEIGAY
ncbi:MAG: cell division/cell wall cluster transcriptional repressor MraZ [Candidatus Niyogibacteria bacterium RIFCSPLOWO2_12_FULL_41_13]|uniref:Transcriptional regulator MraZ n=1 Tax=Candidatus Niyogibacteria bacterium RIFCSPLOWO2_12_FULL_41_13 TaxID=1801726 RepID=A0A1G2F3W6_9BACT|nr:MAG: cell division/cell wall cluster transcriptional repressor MraZ [Candidatus Niyogibacteria bacterium RIFCSPLOWO2_12_FULL_41_13]